VGANSEQRRTTATARPLVVLVLAALTLVLAGCSGSADEADSTSTVEEASAVEATQGAESDQAETTTTEERSSGSAPPASRADENPPVAGDKHWIGRGTMTSSSIELVWSPVIDATGYQVYRLDDIIGFDPDTVPLDDAVLVFDGDASVTVDSDVVEGAFYTYVLEVQMSDGPLPRRWTQTLAMDDTTPPSPITNLEVSAGPDGVLLTWDESSDDIEFASYSVSVLEGDQLRYIGGGGDPEVTSFLDARPPAGIVTYSVQAVDFHDNRTEPVEIQYDNR
jgi:hypothetical protein